MLRFVVAALGLGMILFFVGVFLFHWEGNTDVLVLSLLTLAAADVVGIGHLTWLKIRKKDTDE